MKKDFPSSVQIIDQEVCFIVISLKKTFGKKKLISLALSAAFILSSFPSLLLTSCKRGEEKPVKPADYGSYGSDLARKIAADFPERKPYSEGEKAAGEALREEMIKLGFQPEVQSFSSENGTSQNYVVKIPGTGFYSVSDDGKVAIKHRIAVIGAHYDNLPPTDKKVQAKIINQKVVKKGEATSETTQLEYSYDGINDNASGTACLLTAMKAFKEYNSIKEFNGFIPKQIPDEVVYVVYSVNSCGADGMTIFLNYYTTYKDLETLRKREQNDEIEKEKEDDNNINIEENEEDARYIYLNIGDDKNNEIKIGKNENSFLLNNYESFKDNQSSYIQIRDRTIKNNKKVEPFLLRYIFYNNKNTDTLFNDIKINDDDKEEKYNENYFIPAFNNMGYIKENNYGEIISVYRKNSERSFPNYFSDNMTIINKNKITFHTENYFNVGKE